MPWMPLLLALAVGAYLAARRWPFFLPGLAFFLGYAVILGAVALGATIHDHGVPPWAAIGATAIACAPGLSDMLAFPARPWLSRLEPLLAAALALWAGLPAEGAWVVGASLARVAAREAAERALARAFSPEAIAAGLAAKSPAERQFQPEGIRGLRAVAAEAGLGAAVEFNLVGLRALADVPAAARALEAAATGDWAAVKADPSFDVMADAMLVVALRGGGAAAWAVLKAPYEPFEPQSVITWGPAQAEPEGEWAPL